MTVLLKKKNKKKNVHIADNTQPRAYPISEATNENCRRFGHLNKHKIILYNIYTRKKTYTIKYNVRETSMDYFNIIWLI